MEIAEIRLGPLDQTAIALQELADKENEVIRNLLALASDTVTWDEVEGKPEVFPPDPEMLPELVAHWDTLEGKPDTFPPSTHTHPWDQITGAPDLNSIPGALDASKLFGTAALDNLIVSNSISALTFAADSALLAALTADSAEIAGVAINTGGLDLTSLSSTAQIHMPPGAVVSTNLNAALLDSEEGAYYLDRANHTGTQNVSTLDPGAESGVLTINAGLPSWGLLMDANVAALAGIDANKLGGNLPYAVMPTGSGTWDVGAGNLLTLARAPLFSTGIRVEGATFADANILFRNALAPGPWYFLQFNTGGFALSYNATTSANTRLQVNTDGSVSLGALGSFGSGSRVVFIPNATTIPTTNPVGGGILYVTGGALTYRGSAGTVTTLAVA